ncbi:MAG: hypothetical protein R3F61_25810 [Myxococcota bacterium]
MCALCLAGELEPEPCHPCTLVDASAGRVSYDVVDADGRPFADHEIMVSTSCSQMGGWGGGFLDLPEGRCELVASRVDGPFTISGPPVVVEVVTGEELYASLEVPSEPWGGVGVTLRPGEDGVVVEGLLVGAAATGRIPEGATIVAVDGVDVAWALPREVGALLSGPAGTEVEVRVRADGVEETVVVRRQPIRASEVGITAGPPG